MIDTDKYAGHTEGPWTLYHRAGSKPTLAYPVTIAGKLSEVDWELIADAPLLLAEVKRLVRALRNADDVIKYALEMTSDDDATRVFEDYLEVNKND